MRAIILFRLARPLALTLTILLTAASASAQLVSDGATAFINGTATNIAGFMIIGNTGPNTTLIVTNGGSVTSDSTGLGGNPTSTNNLVAVSGAGSRMTTPGGGSVFRIGDGSAYNRLIISEGGAVTTGYGVVGYPVAATNNSVLVTGSGSVFTNDVFFVGEGGSSNSVTVADGGRVQTAFISAIGVVASASNNWVAVTGTNSLWNTGGDVSVGDAAGQNRLFVNNGGRVTSGANIILGNQSTSSGNLLSVAAGTVTATNAFGTGTLDVRRGSVEFKGGLITADRLLATNAQSSFTFNGGTLITRSATVNNGQGFVLGATAGTGPAGAGFTNSTAISLPAFAAATPYPSTISIANVAGTVSRVTVTIKNLSHTASGELSVLLVGPNGAAVMLMSAAGFTSAANNVTLTFDDAAINPTPIFTALTSGMYFPTNYSSIGLPSPAPSSPYSTQLASFNGSDANGNWSLFVYDAQAGNGGSIAGGWSLKLETTTPPPSTWDLRSNAVPTVLAKNLSVGGNAANATLLITNGATLSTGSLQSDISRLGASVSSSNNFAVIANPGSLWINTGSILVGEFSSFNSLLVANGGRLVNQFGYRIGWNPGANNNQVVVSGQNSELDALFLYAGDGGAFNTLLITNGGKVVSDSARIGLQIGANSNQVIVSSNNSTWVNNNDMYVGFNGSFNTLLITNGGRVVNANCSIGYASDANSNQVIVSGANSTWDNSDYLDVGDYGSSNTLLITNGGVVLAASAYVGLPGGGSNNLLSLGNGTLTVTNVSGNAVLEVSIGNLVFNGGAITADQLLLTNGALSTFSFNNGTLNTRAAAVTNGSLFTVGNGSSPATYNLSGSATNLHSFADGFNVPANASLTGNGTISGTLVISGGGTLAPGTSIGKIILNSAPYLLGTVAMEISKTGSTLTNDQLQVTGLFVEGGALTVTKIGATALAAGDSFKLFNAGSYLGSFSSITLPALAPGLSWTNTLSLNGTIAVTGTAIVIPPSISSLTKTGTNLIFNVTGGAASGPWNLLTSTNVALPLANWTTNRSGIFDGSGNVTFTNGINAAEPQRYFRIKTP